MISLRGRQSRPWLEIRRPETQRTYLDHQLRRLRKLHDGPVDALMDVVPTPGFYDDHRIRLHGEGLYRAYELLYPRDEKQISQEVLDIAGMDGLVALWCDCGVVRPTYHAIQLRLDPEASTLLAAWIESLGLGCYRSPSGPERYEIRFYQSDAERLAKELRRHIHPSMRRTLRLSRR